MTDVAEHTRHLDEENSRRTLLTVLGAGGIAALASLGLAKPAKAGRDGTNTFHLGVGNAISAGQQSR